MIPGRILYRVRQFWNALFLVPSRDDLELVTQELTTEQMFLFRQMHRSEQAHSLRVMRAVMNASDIFSVEQRKYLRQAALLHDVGKTRFPLRLWERVLIVLVKALMPDSLHEWGEGEPRGWRRAFVVARQHPLWGAQMAAEAGSPPLAVSLIERHQELLDPAAETLEDRLLRLLQSADHQV